MSLLTPIRPAASAAPVRVTPDDFAPSRAHRIVVTPEPASVGDARRFATAWCGRYGVPAAIAEDVALIVSEAVTNAILHAAFPPGRECIAVELAKYGPFVSVQVCDPDSCPAAVAALHAVVADDSPVDLLSEHGRGMAIVRPLSCGIDVSVAGRQRCLSVFVDCLPSKCF